MFQVKIGMRNMVMPGARIVMIVVMKFTAPRIVPNPLRARPTTQRFPPTPGENVVAGQRGVRQPTEGCSALRGEESGDGDEATEVEEPVGEGVQTRERHVGSADLQRHEHVRETREERGREHEQHDRAVHREQLVVLLFGLQQRTDPGAKSCARMIERHHAAEAEVDERGDQVHVPDRLVVGGGDPLQDVSPLGCAVRSHSPRRRAGRRPRVGPRWRGRRSQHSSLTRLGRVQGCTSRLRRRAEH